LITFTSAETSPSSGDWAGVYFADTSVDNSCIIKYATIAFAGVGVQTTEASPRIEKTSFIHCYDAGVEVFGESPTVVDCVFHDNAGGEGAGVWCSGSGTPSITGCSFFDNSKGIDLFGTLGHYPNPTINNNSIFGNGWNVYAIAANDLSARKFPRFDGHLVKS
jgi:parallel beta-helix repeat protein